MSPIIPVAEYVKVEHVEGLEQYLDGGACVCGAGGGVYAGGRV
jgi:hypothetical protein